MLITLACLSASAQVDNEKVAAAVHKDGFGLSLGAGGSNAAGNLGMYDLRGQLGVQFRRSFPSKDGETPWIRDLAILNASGSYLSLGGQPLFDNRLVSLGYVRMAVHRFGFDLATQYQNNRLLLLDARWTAAIASRFILVRTDRLEWGGGVGAMVEHEVRNVDAQGPDARVVTNPRVVGRVSWRIDLVPDTVIWRHTLYVEPRMDRWSDHLIVDYNTLEARVTKILSVTSNLQFRYDSQPPADLKKLDTRFNWGVTFRWAARPHDDHPHH